MPKPIIEDLPIGEILYKWTVPEYEKHERGTLWYALILGFGSLLVIYGLFSNNFLFALIIILAGIILFIQSRQEAPDVSVQITEFGVGLGGRFYSYSELDNFYIIYQPPDVKTLFIETVAHFRPLLRIPLLDQNPLDIRSDLRAFLKEDVEKEEEPRSDTLARSWKIH